MDPFDITEFAKLLKDNGDKVLNSEFKLSLSGSFLRALNDSFIFIVDDIEILPVCGFQVTKSNNSKHTNVFRELQFIHDFVQKTIVLCLNNFLDEDLFYGLDISKFRNLRTLEIQKVSIKQIEGIQQLRAQLREIICIRCLTSTRELISDCGGDNSNGFIWNELKRLDLSYNAMEKVDSFEFTPYVQCLNLSHNQINNVSAIKWLPNLKILNLSFNQLTHIPKFNTETYRRLQVLIINDNFIEDVSGLDRMVALAELDLGGNCMLDHSMLLPLSTLSALCYLNLLGNPLSCHPKHRVATSRYLNKNAASMKFLLDKSPLSNHEKSLAGSCEHYYPIFGHRLNSISSRSSNQNTPTPSVKSVSSTPENSSFSSMSSLINQQEPKIIEEQYCAIGQQRKIKPRPVIISEITEVTEDTKMVVKKDLKELPGLEGNKEHLETKQKIEQLRAKFGKEWLQSQGASMVHNVMGFEESVNQEKLDKNYDHLFFSSPTRQIDKSKNMEEIMTTSTPIDTTLDNSMNTSDQTIYQSALDTTGSAAYTTADDTLTFVENEEIVISDAEENESKFLVIDNRTKEEYFLVVSEENIKEKETMTGRTKTRWGMKTLESCDRTKSNVIRLNFDTIRKDKKERIYRMEIECCQQLEKILRDVMANRPLSEMNQVVYKCASCNTQFSREVNPHNSKKNDIGDLRCPECKNIYVIVMSNPTSKSNVEIKQVRPSTSSNSLLSNLPITIDKRVEPLKVSQSQSSIGSATSLNSSSCSKISSSFNSNQSVAGSTNSDRDKDTDLNSRSGNESDVEILSNPSQSSIEVLDADSISQTFAMDRRFSVDAINDESITTNFDINLMLNQEVVKAERKEKLTKSKVSKKANDKMLLGTGTLNLTESSSSGSVTDSVCTTYEQNKSSMSKSNDSTKSPLEESKSKDSLGLGSMLGGLFQSTNLLLAKTAKKDVESSISQPFETIQYSYDDLSMVDHRLKLYLFQTLFEDIGENLVWLIKGHIVDDEFVASGAGAYSGMVILSTTKFYVLKECGPENEEINTWLKKSVSGTIDRVEQIRALPWKIGVTFKIKGIASIHLILQDILRTDNALNYFNNHLQSTCSIEYQVHSHLQKKLQAATNNEPIKRLAVFKSCDFMIDNVPKTVNLGSLIVTDTELILIKSDFQWICDASVKNYENYETCVSVRQQMTNLIELDNLSANAFNFNFMDETENKFETWKFVFDDKTNIVEEVLKTVSDIWQKIFHVPLINS